jgi:hypothetical protein
MLPIGVLINALVATVICASGEYPDVLGQIMFGFVALSIAGIVLVAAGSRRTGAIVAMIGSVVFVPIGIIGAIGARKILDQLKQEEFERRRTA